MDEGQMKEYRATVQVHVVAIERPKPSKYPRSSKWQIENSWSNSRHEQLRFCEKQMTRKK